MRPHWHRCALGFINNGDFIAMAHGSQAPEQIRCQKRVQVFEQFSPLRFSQRARHAICPSPLWDQRPGYWHSPERYATRSCFDAGSARRSFPKFSIGERESDMTILVTGAAGFVGFHVVSALLERGEAVVGVDNLNGYYDVGLKQDRLSQLTERDGFTFKKAGVEDRSAMQSVFESAGSITSIVHLAAQAGVRYSLIDPYAYVSTNVMGQVVLCELARHCPDLRHFVYASSSSVYGLSDSIPYSVDNPADQPASLYAATKRADELISHTYSHLYQMPMTGLRFFTVYGPWGRPDMAYFIFTKAIIEERPISLYNHGDMNRDFTYVDDAVQGVLAAVDSPPPVNGKAARHRVLNLGNSQPQQLQEFVSVLEDAIGKKAIIEPHPMMPGDVVTTSAEISKSRELLGFDPTVTIEDGLPRFVSWYKQYYRCN